VFCAVLRIKADLRTYLTSDDEDAKMDSDYSLLDEDDKKEVLEDAVQDESIHMRPRLPKRQKKPPTTRSENFLW